MDKFSDKFSKNSAESIINKKNYENQVAENAENSPAPEKIDYEAQLAEMKERMLRALADADNTKKRTENQLKETKLYANSGFAKDLIAPIENLFRVLENLPAEVKEDWAVHVRDGLNLTIKEFQNAMERNGLKRVMPTLGEKFDHNIHQAVAQFADPDKEDGTIMNVMQAGYIMNDRLIQPAMVAVAKSDKKPQDETLEIEDNNA